MCAEVDHSNLLGNWLLLGLQRELPMEQDLFQG
jgi:hypothetical protein